MTWDAQLHQRQLLLLQPLLLLGKDDAAHFQHALEALAALDGVFLEARAQRVLDAVLDALPAAAQGRDAGSLGELRLVLAGRAVDDLLLHAHQVAPRQVLADHCDCLALRVDVAGLVDEALLHVAAQQRLDPVGRGLLACDEAFGAQDAGCGIDLARERVDGDDVLGLVVPRAVLAPVGG